jgi:ABC-type polysaccharide/polyol phosphate transport system ATPase subunit
MIDLTFDGVSKKYRIYRESEELNRGPRLVQKARKLMSGWQDFWALKNVSFEIAQGEAVGIIGHNGAGKSTILKLLYNITTPSNGEIRINGRLAALIEVASGFHPELTGRENVFLNGSLLGMKRREIAEKLDSIVEFAGVSQFIDTPVKRYSTGMYLRLGFAIAAHLDPDVLLLDEILAVGDAEFQTKCIERINQLKRNGKTIVFVSHNLAAVESLCDRVFLLRKGELYRTGPAQSVIAEYEHLLGEMSAQATSELGAGDSRPAAQITSVTTFDSDGRKTTSIATGDPIRVEVAYQANELVPDAVVELYFYSIFGNLHSHFSTAGSDHAIELRPGKGVIEFQCPAVLLEVAAFNVEASIRHRGTDFGDRIDHKQLAVLNVGRGKPVHGVFYMPHSFKLREEA